jgi:hypothetical protein
MSGGATPAQIGGAAHGFSRQGRDRGGDRRAPPRPCAACRPGSTSTCLIWWTPAAPAAAAQAVQHLHRRRVRRRRRGAHVAKHGNRKMTSAERQRRRARGGRRRPDPDARADRPVHREAGRRLSVRPGAPRRHAPRSAGASGTRRAHPDERARSAHQSGRRQTSGHRRVQPQFQETLAEVSRLLDAERAGGAQQRPRRDRPRRHHLRGGARRRRITATRSPPSHFGIERRSPPSCAPTRPKPAWPWCAALGEPDSAAADIVA